MPLVPTTVPPAAVHPEPEPAINSNAEEGVLPELDPQPHSESLNGI